MASLVHKYIPKVTQREENLFVEEYFSGTDTKIYIAGEEQKEISYIQYSVNEQLKPIYGYNSRTFDDISVGNRIVTGVLKIPIKNNQSQSSDEEIKAGITKTTQDSINEFNETEEANKGNTEWITENSNEGAQTDNSVFEFQSKLISLGYDSSDSGWLDDQTKKAIKAFQSDHNIYISQTLTTETKSSINDAISKGNLKTVYLNAETKLYSGPSESFYTISTLASNTKLFVIDDSFDDYIMVNTEDGKTGYIKKEYVG
jgi:hypothetical protein